MWLCESFLFEATSVRDHVEVFVFPSNKNNHHIYFQFSPPCLDDGDINCNHTNCGYHKTNEYGESLSTWAAINNLSLFYNPKGPASFHSSYWGTTTNPDLAFSIAYFIKRIPRREVLENFPQSQHRPSLDCCVENLNICSRCTSKAIELQEDWLKPL